MDLPSLSGQSQLITYQIGGDETMYEAITDAFRAIDVDVYQEDTTVEDWTEGCPIDSINWDLDSPCRVSTIIWDHPAVITADEIRIYEDPRISHLYRRFK